MKKEHSPAYIFGTHDAAEKAIRSLGQAGFDVRKLSLLGRGYHSEEHPVGFRTVGERIRSWGGVGALFGGVWGLLLAPTVFFFLPGLGLMATAGPLVSALVGAFEGALFVGGASALGAALTDIGVTGDRVIEYETALKVDKYLLIVHGNADEIAQAASVLTDVATTA
ncbi:hypothetical protein SAMN04515618_10166 [Collimonas sp. OK307]|uniref:DUF1269 domain-containing family protein n=1 Tax=Collimonas sp. OK307 TaxID=1801620 RepID=UPI0008EF71A2|nr:DUF1269 domain-containing family protein [Collimonas sp. OK307]SFH60967.1 hypothetical protein SAMN04515618_10166 [Collimonas sp. OK307]